MSIFSSQREVSKAIFDILQEEIPNNPKLMSWENWKVIIEPRLRERGILDTKLKEQSN